MDFTKFIKFSKYLNTGSNHLKISRSYQFLPVTMKKTIIYSKNHKIKEIAKDNNNSLRFSIPI